ncbi:MAG TPA: hypothetical protein VGU67_09985 [Edaphobacter sp.]|nr:hypothetical protein [Edaphobacter sp.]
MMNRRDFLIQSVFSLTTASVKATTPTAPRPYGAVPLPRQLEWHALETYGFLHFTVNTFTGEEVGYGDEDPSLFNPVISTPIRSSPR